MDIRKIKGICNRPEIHRKNKK